MKISKSTSKLKVTFVDSKEKSTALGLVDNYKNLKGEFESFFWNCTCINKAKSVADTLKKGDFVTIGDAEVFVKKDSKGNGNMLVFSLEQVFVETSAEDKSKTESKPEEVSTSTQSADEYGMGDEQLTDDDRPF